MDLRRPEAEGGTYGGACGSRGPASRNNLEPWWLARDSGNALCARVWRYTSGHLSSAPPRGEGQQLAANGRGSEP